MAKDTEETTEVELTTKQVINEGIDRVIEATGIDGQKSRYKAMRAVAYEAFAQAVENGTFDDLIESAISNVDELPAGWELERTEKAEAPAKKAPAAKAAPKAAAKPAAKAAPAAKASGAKPAARRRPTR